MAEHVFPQDEATGATQGSDWDDAAAFAQHEHTHNTTAHVISGCELSVNYTTNVLNIGTGVLKVYQSSAATNDHTAQNGPAANTLRETTFTAQYDPSGDIGLPDNAVSNVYLSVDQSANNAVNDSVRQDQTLPPEPFLLIGRIDTGANTSRELNRHARGSFGGFVLGR